MSAPALPPRRRALALRVLLAAAFVTAGFVAVCHGFGLAGFGTQDHSQRNFATLVPLVAGAAVLVWPRRRVWVRGGAALIGLGLAAGAWWVVPCRDDGMSLQGAVARRDELKGRLAELSPDDIDSGVVIKQNIDTLQSQYGELGVSLRSDLHVWAFLSAEASVTRFRQIPLDNAPAARVLEERVRKLASHFPRESALISEAVVIWIARSTARRKNELEKLPPGDWAAFDRTAPDRLALTEIGIGTFAMKTREVLVKAEEDWVNDSVEALIDRPDATNGAQAQMWVTVENDLMALKSLNTDDDRFKAARRRLFDLAHASTVAETSRLIKAERYNAALGVARKHEAAWNATAAVLGARDARKLEALSEKCAALVQPGVADPPEIAPLPRAKPQ